MKTMNISHINLICIFGLLSFSPCLCRAERDGKTESNLNKNKNSTDIAKGLAKNKEFNTVKVVRQKIRVNLNLKGYFEDADAMPFSINTQSWSEIKVVTPPTHGKAVKKGDSLLKIDLNNIQKKLRELDHELAILNLNQ